MTIQIGTYNTIQGAIGNDVAYVTPKIAYFGNSGDDDIWLGGSEYLYLENQYWWVPSIAVGGTGNDKYTIAQGFTFIADGSKSNADKLLIYGSLDEIEVLFSIDERHIFISLSSETTMIVLFDALNELGAIEIIQFQKSSASRPVTISTDSLMNYRSLPNQTFESLISGGFYFNKVMGVANANEVRNIINRISELTTTDYSYSLSKLSGLTSPNSLIGAFENYQFYNLGGNRQGIQKKGTGAIDEITGISTLTFNDSRISVSDNIIGVFNQVTGKETKDAQMFRLYNAAFNRFPDSDGLKYWNNEYSKGINNYKNIAESFIISNEFKQRYGATNTNLEFATNMYKNILGRLPDSDGLNYWVSNLNAGANSRVDVLGGFSESVENKNLFSQVTGFI